MSAGNEIGDLLLDIGLITDEELASAHEEQAKTGERLTLVLERLGLITHHQLKDALSNCSSASISFRWPNHHRLNK